MSDLRVGPAQPGARGNNHTAAGTARFIARNLLVAACDERHSALLPAGSRESYRRLLCTAGDRWFVHAAGSRVCRAIFRVAVGLILPGIGLHYIARKCCLEEWQRQVCAREDPAAGDCRQVVVLGAGLDTLAWRLHGQRPELSFIELDRPAALRIKAEAMPADGPRRWNLTAAGGSHRFAFTCMEARADGRIGFRRSNPVVNWWLHRQGEPFRWSQAPDSLSAFLEPLGFVLREIVSDDTLRARYLEPAGLRNASLAAGEFLAFAQTDIAP